MHARSDGRRTSRATVVEEQEERHDHHADRDPRHRPPPPVSAVRRASRVPLSNGARWPPVSLLSWPWSSAYAASSIVHGRNPSGCTEGGPPYGCVVRKPIASGSMP